jgi:hypothetical protein
MVLFYQRFPVEPIDLGREFETSLVVRLMVVPEPASGFEGVSMVVPDGNFAYPGR